MKFTRELLSVILFFSLTTQISSDSDKGADSWKKKNIRDYNDVDIEKLFDQWEENDEPLEDDEVPAYKKPAPKIDMSKIDTSNPEKILEASKKGVSLMTFVKVSGNPTKEEAEKLTSIWQVALRNDHINVERFMIEDNRAIFLFQDGSMAFQAKEYLLSQDRLHSLTIDGKVYNGKYAEKTEL